MKKPEQTKKTPLLTMVSLKRKNERHKISIILGFLILCMTQTNAFAYYQLVDPITITGTVTDSEGLPLPGATVMEKNTNNGVITDFDGHFSIKVSSENSILIFSYVGLKSSELTVGTKTQLNIQLQADPQSLDEVVLVGYGTQKKISVVGAQSTIRTQELQQPVANVSTMLAGRIAGLTGVQRSGLPGFDGADLWIRGISSFGANGPLILVDGVERSLDNIDPRDIASFSILKDASATAVYGIRGANGVILIETKRGKIGKPEVSIDYNEGITAFTKIPDMVDGVTYMTLANEALTTRGQNPKFSQEYINNTASNIDPLLYPNVDWIDTVFNDFGRNRKASVNVTGGAEDALYYVSVGYYDETGLFITDGLEGYDSDTKFKRFNFTSNLTIDITNTTKIDLGIQGYVSEGNYPNESVGTIFSSALAISPVEYPILYPGGFIPGRSSNGGFRNPYADVALRGYKNTNKNQLYSNLRINQELSFLTQGLSWTAMFSFDNYNQHEIRRGKRQSTYFVDQNFPYTDDGELLLVETFEGTNYLGYDRNNGGNRRFYLETSFNYNKDFGKHGVSGLLLFNRTDYVDAFAGNFTDAIPFRNEGIALRGTYSYDDRYFFEVNAGYNGSENFAPSNRYGFFPSMAAGWIVSNEKFFKPLKDHIDYFKIRYSDGKVGSSSGAGRFAYLSRVEDDQDGYSFGANRQGISGIRETYYGVDVSWSEARKQDIGIELNAFNNDLRVIVDFFKERTEGAFLERGDIPNYIGLTTDPYGNLGIVENKGVDGSINYGKSVNNLRLDFRSTFSYNKNKIVENGQPEQLYPWLDKKGTPLLANFGLIAERLYTLEDDMNGDGFISSDDSAEFPSQFGQIMPGDIKYTDLNGDGLIDSNDKKQIGDGDVPALTYGFGLTAQYKGFDASVFFQGQSSASRFIGGSGIFPFIGGGGAGNLFTTALDRWTPENNNPYATTPRLSFDESGIGQNNNRQESTWWLRDIDFLRLKTAEIGYTLPKEFTEKINLTSTRFYIRGTNLLTFSKFDLWDPELNTNNGNSYPNISVISIGFNVIF